MKSFLHKPEPLLVRNVNGLKPLLNRLPALHELNLNQTLNTIVSCRVCYGHGHIYTRNSKFGTLHKTHCLHCNGSREMSNREL